MNKIGLVVEGGGMKCAYSAGILDAFLKDNINFDYCIGVSAGSANVASYLARQYGRNLRFYTTHISEPGYFGLKSYLKTRNLFGLDYIYGTLSNSDGADALDFDTLIHNPAEFELVTTDAVSGKPHYFHKEDMKKDDYRIIKASSALPAVCAPVEIDGHLYFDGGVSDSIPVKRAFEDGCDKVVVLLSKPRDYVKQPEGMRRFYSYKCRKFPKIVKCLDNRHNTYTKSQHLAYKLEKEGKAFIFAPSKHLAMGTYAMDAQANQNLYDLGISDYNLSKKSLKTFMHCS